MTITEKLYLGEAIERTNRQRAACMNPAEVSGNWRKCCKYGNTYEVTVDYEYSEELHRRGCTINSNTGWSVEDALRNLNKRLAAWNIQVTSLTKSILSE